VILPELTASQNTSSKHFVSEDIHPKKARGKLTIVINFMEKTTLTGLR
jgi:hypothetical protein